MRILATSDTHGDLPEVDKCDLFIIAGDVCPITNHTVGYQAKWLIDSFKPWLESIDAKHIVWIAGNHDFVLERNQQYYWQDEPLTLKNEILKTMPSHVHYLEDSSITIEGLLIYGLPWVPTLEGWAFYANDEKLYQVYNRVPNETDILISHGPPRGLSDKTSFSHAGSIQALHTLKRVRPTHFICGHIHEGAGYYEEDGLNVWNVSYKDRNYQPVNKVVEIT